MSSGRRTNRASFGFSRRAGSSRVDAASCAVWPRYRSAAWVVDATMELSVHILRTVLSTVLLVPVSSIGALTMREDNSLAGKEEQWRGLG